MATFTDWDESLTHQSEVYLDSMAKSCLYKIDKGTKHGYIIVTGRPTSDLKERIKANELRDDKPMSSENGGVILMPGGEILPHRNSGYAKKVRDKILGEYERGHCMGIYLMENGKYVFQPGVLEDKETMVTFNFNPKFFAKDVEDVDGYDSSCLDKRVAMRRIGPYMRGVVNTLGLNDKGQFLSHLDAFEFVPYGADKKRAIRIISEKCGIDPSECAAIGDNLGADWPMMKSVGIPVTFNEAETELIEKVKKSPDGIILKKKYGEGLNEFCDRFGITE